MAKDCRKCKDYRDCEGHFYEVKTETGKQYIAWYEPGEIIKYCPYQVCFIIDSTEVLRAGSWPLNPEESNYIDTGIRTGYASSGYFTKSIEILAEVEYRRKRTGKDGIILKSEIKAGETMNSMEPEAKDALMFIKGKRRKRVGYTLWLAQRNYYKKYSKKEFSKELPK